MVKNLFEAYLKRIKIKMVNELKGKRLEKDHLKRESSKSCPFTVWRVTHGQG